MGRTKTESMATPAIITGPNKASPRCGAALATITSVSEKLAAAAIPQPTAFSAPFFFSPPPNPNKATPAEHNPAPNQNFPDTPPGNRKALPTAVNTTLLPRTGVATDTSPPDNARNVPTCPRKKRREQIIGPNHIQTGKSPVGIFAQNKSGAKQAPIARFDPTKTLRGGCPSSRARFRKIIPPA